MIDYGNHLIIISHRRSGTHLTIDAILNNFRYFKNDYISLDRLKNNSKRFMNLDEFKKILRKGPTVIKTHAYADLSEYFSDDESVSQFVQELLAQAKKIYVSRDGRDVLVSLYLYMKNFSDSVRAVTFSEFIRSNNTFDSKTEMNRVQYWRYHVEQWKNQPDILYITFEEIKNQYAMTLEKISDYLGLRMPERIVNVQLEKQIDYKCRLKHIIINWIYRIYYYLFKGIKLSPILFRKGKKEDYKKYFNNEDHVFFNKYIQGHED